MQTKKTLLTIVFSLTIIGAGCNTTTENQTNKTTKNTETNTLVKAEPMKYKDFKMGITLYYPADWKTQGQDNGSIIFYPKNQENLADKTGTNLGLSTQDLSKFPPVTLDQYTEIIKADTLKRLTNANIISTEKITIGGLEGAVMTYTATYPNLTDKTMKVRHAYVLKEKTAYLLTYTATTENFDTYVESTKEIVSSFKFD